MLAEVVRLSADEGLLLEVPVKDFLDLEHRMRGFFHREAMFLRATRQKSGVAELVSGG